MFLEIVLYKCVVSGLLNSGLSFLLQEWPVATAMKEEGENEVHTHAAAQGHVYCEDTITDQEEHIQANNVSLYFALFPSLSLSPSLPPYQCLAARRDGGIGGGRQSEGHEHR